MTTRLIACPFCQHLFPRDGGTPKCNAFPLEIPREIVVGDNYHTEPYPGDGGVRFKALPEWEYLTKEFESFDAARTSRETAALSGES